METKKIAILGGGITGLSLLYFLKKYNVQGSFYLFEKEEIGGWIQSNTNHSFFFEKGPKTLRFQDKKKALNELIANLGLEKEKIFPVEEGKKKYILYKKKITPIPEGLWEWFFSPFLFVFLGALFKDLFSLKGTKNEESVASFFQRRFGKKWTKTIGNPLIKGIYATSPENISLNMAFPDWKEREKKDRSLLISFLKEKKREKQVPFYSFSLGLGSLIKTLKKEIGKIALRGAVFSLKKKNNQIEISSEGFLECFDIVFSTLNFPSLSQIIEPSFFLQTIQNLPYQTLVCVYIGFKNQNFLLKNKGFGFLVPDTEKSDLIGCVFDSNLFREKKEEETRITLMIQPSQEKFSKKIIQIIEEVLRVFLGITAFPDYVRIEKKREAIPSYLPYFEDFRNKVLFEKEQIYPGLFLAGPSLYGVSVADCVESAEQQVKKLIEKNEETKYTQVI